MWKHILEQGLGFSLVAFRDATPLAGGVFFKFNKTLSFKYSASNMAFKSLHGSHAVVRAAIQRAHDEGCTTFDFGRSEICNLGLRRFKNNWGATESDLSYTIISNVPPFYRSPILDQILGQVIRHSPTFICKLTGKVLYRHFA
jgi:lipid II:glycine glycyltransferase (peptidoglycan interpeptide bridge formation enzyme)